jgi:hypothetical protein
MRRFLNEPLVHFAAIGGLLFALYSLVSPRENGRRDEIVVDRQRVTELIAEHERTWQRPPSADERKRMIDAWVRDEVLFREGIKAGFEADDVVVRRRVVQKMTFLAEGMAADVPSDAEVEAWFKAHADDYRLEPTTTFRQVFFESNRGDPDAETVLTAARAALEADAGAAVGDRTALPSALPDASASDVARVFGDEFASALSALDEGKWATVRSNFGLHLVRIDARKPARVPELAAVRKAVESDVARSRTEKSVEAFYRAARARYDVRVEADAMNAGVTPVSSGATPKSGR